jgi:hypothetical protein
MDLKELMAKMESMLAEFKTLRAEFDGIKASTNTDAATRAAKERETAERMDKLAKDFGELNGRFNAANAAGAGVPTGGKGAAIKSLGRQVVELDAIQKNRVESGERAVLAVKCSMFAAMRRKADSGITTDSITALGTISGERIQEFAQTPKRKAFLRDFMTVRPVSAATVYWVERTGFNHLWTTTTDTAASGQKNVKLTNVNGLMVGQVLTIDADSATDRETGTIATITKTGTNGATGTVTLSSNLAKTHSSGVAVTSEVFNFTASTNIKPSSRIALAARSTDVRTLAHHITLPKEILADIEQLRANVDDDLLYGLALSEEWQILYGNNVSPAIQGILTHASIKTFKWSDGVVGDLQVDAIRRGITLANLANSPVNLIVMHPLDLEDVELSKGEDGHYLIVKTVADGGDTGRLWRVPVFETTAISEGTVLVGDFMAGCTLWDREAGTVSVATQHEDNFTRNMLTILAEERVALAIKSPESFCAITLDHAPTGGS